jgi:23S rRNA pseudouridine2457 synthase
MQKRLPRSTIERRAAAATLRYVKMFKPFGMLTRFTDNDGRATLKDIVPLRGIYPVGRLDRDSEGLVLLTDDGPLAHRLTDPRFEHPKTYLVQVERVPHENALESLRRGVELRGGRSRPAEAEMLAEPPALPERSKPIRFRKQVPTAWLRLILREGRNRQIRRMTAVVGHPTLRLVRVGIGALMLGDLKPGEWRELSEEERTALGIRRTIGWSPGSSGE